MKEISESINTIAAEHLEFIGTTRPRAVYDEFTSRFPGLQQVYGEQLAARGLMRMIKQALRGKVNSEGGRIAQLHLPGMEAPATITNQVNDDQQDGGFIYIRFDLATREQLLRYDEILQKNISDANAKRIDLSLKLRHLAPAFEHDPNFTVAEACRWLAKQEVAA